MPLLSPMLSQFNTVMGWGIDGWCGYLPHIVNSSLCGFYTARCYPSNRTEHKGIRALNGSSWWETGLVSCWVWTVYRLAVGHLCSWSWRHWSLLCCQFGKHRPVRGCHTVYSLITWYFKISIILLSTLRYHNWPILFRFLKQNFISTSHLRHSLTWSNAEKCYIYIYIYMQ
jgi:hypothetical protein